MSAAAAGSPLRVSVYEMPSEFTTALLQYRGVHSAPHRETNVYGASQLVQGSLYAMETALHEWLLDSRLRPMVEALHAVATHVDSEAVAAAATAKPAKPKPPAAVDASAVARAVACALPTGRQGGGGRGRGQG